VKQLGAVGAQVVELAESLYVPAWHWLQLVALSTGEAVPAGQSVQAVALLLAPKEPAAQGRQGPPTPAAKYPASQGRQSEARLDFAARVLLPPGQFLQARSGALALTGPL
jgi:hypothetical protein